MIRIKEDNKKFTICTMFSEDNLPPILSKISQEYLTHLIVQDFDVYRLNEIERLEAEINEYHQLENYSSISITQRHMLDLFGHGDDWASREHEIEYWIGKADFYFKFCRFNKKDSILSFGKYNGLTLGWVAENDFDYLEYCMRTVDRFFLNRTYLIELCNQNYLFSSETVSDYRVKRTENIAHIKVHNAAVRAHDALNSPYLTYDSDDDNSWGGNPSSNPYYDDNLDMDQQSQDFWDNL